jgi:hypothetical protein
MRTQDIEHRTERRNGPLVAWIMPTAVVLSANTFHILNKKGSLPAWLPSGAISNHVAFAPLVWLGMVFLSAGYLCAAIFQSRPSLRHRPFAPLALGIGISAIHYISAGIVCYLTVGSVGEFLELLLDP